MGVSLRGQDSIRSRQHISNGVGFADHIIDAGFVVILFGNHFGIAGGDDHSWMYASGEFMN